MPRSFILAYRDTSDAVVQRELNEVSYSRQVPVKISRGMSSVLTDKYQIVIFEHLGIADGEILTSLFRISMVAPGTQPTLRTETAEEFLDAMVSRSLSRNAYFNFLIKAADQYKNPDNAETTLYARLLEAVQEEVRPTVELEATDE
jgi:hypothetical protein